MKSGSKNEGMLKGTDGGDAGRRGHGIVRRRVRSKLAKRRVGSGEFLPSRANCPVPLRNVCA